MRRLFLVAPFWLLPLAAQASDLTVTVDGVPAGTEIRVLLMDGREHQTLQDHIRGTKTITADGKLVSTTFMGLPPGDYDVVAYRSGASARDVGETRVHLTPAPTTLALSLSH